MSAAADGHHHRTRTAKQVLRLGDTASSESGSARPTFKRSEVLAPIAKRQHVVQDLRRPYELMGII